MLLSCALILEVGCYTMYVGSLETRNQSLSWLLFKFEGRIPRLDFWIVQQALILVQVIFVLSAVEISFAGLINLLFMGGLVIWVTLAVQVKRWHDRGKSGWMVLINLIPIVGVIWTIVELGFLEGSVGPNQYGPEPSKSPI